MTKHLIPLSLLIFNFQFSIFNSPVFAYHETLPTHTPTPPATTITAQITPTPSQPETAFQANPNDRRTLLSLLGLVAVGGLILFLTRPK